MGARYGCGCVSAYGEYGCDELGCASVRECADLPLHLRLIAYNGYFGWTLCLFYVQDAAVVDQRAIALEEARRLLSAGGFVVRNGDGQAYGYALISGVASYSARLR